MIQKIRQRLLILASLFTLAVPVLAPATVSAQDIIRNGLCKGAQDLTVTAGTSQCTEQDVGFTATLRKIVNILSVLIGVIAVIMIIIAGFRYITSGGKQESVTAAKITILYAIIGLVIVALAQVIVRFVLSNVNNT